GGAALFGKGLLAGLAATMFAVGVAKYWTGEPPPQEKHMPVTPSGALSARPPDAVPPTAVAAPILLSATPSSHFVTSPGPEPSAIPEPAPAPSAFDEVAAQRALLDRARAALAANR